MKEHNVLPPTEYWDKPESFADLSHVFELLKDFADQEEIYDAWSSGTREWTNINQEHLTQFIELLATNLDMSHDEARQYFEKCRIELTNCGALSASYTTKRLVFVEFRPLNHKDYQQTFQHSTRSKEETLKSLGKYSVIVPTVDPNREYRLKKYREAVERQRGA